MPAVRKPYILSSEYKEIYIKYIRRIGMKRLMSVFVVLAILFASFTGAVYADTIVYITKSGDKYHNENCKYLRTSKISISLSDAIARGYTPCSECSAPVSVHTHTWDSGKVTTPATCISTGIKTYTCTTCRETTTEQIPVDPNAHDWECTLMTSRPEGYLHGYGYFQCRLCKAEKQDEICPSAKFVDVKNDWSHQAIDYAVTMGITTGTDPSHFKPNDTCTRAQVVTFLWRAAGQPEPVTVNNPFVDVSSNAYYYKAVLWAAEKNITVGLNDGTGRFGINLPCTREQCVTFLYRSAGYPEVGTHQEFTDVEQGRYYYDSISWAASKGITVGLNDGTGRFGVGSRCTRAMIVTFIFRSIFQH